MFRLFNRQKLNESDKLYMPEDRASDALQNLLYHYSPTCKFARDLVLLEKVCVVVYSLVSPLKVGLQK
jgi:hypothetical protein